MGDVSDNVKEILEGRWNHYFSDLWELLEENPDDTNSRDMVVNKLESLSPNHGLELYYSGDYQPNHPMWKYMTSFNGWLPEDFDPSLLPHLSYLGVHGKDYDFRQLTDAILEKIARLPAMKRLRVEFGGITNLEPLRGLELLENIDLNSTPQIADISALTSLPNLKELVLYGLTPDLDLSVINEIQGLYELRLESFDACEDLTWITEDGLKNLERLAIKFVPPFKSLEGVNRLPKLRHLYLDYNSGLTSLEPLRNCRQLEIITVNDCGNLKDVAALVTLPNIERCFMQDCPKLEVKPRSESMYEDEFKVYQKKVKKFYADKSSGKKETTGPQGKLAKALLKIVDREGSVDFHHLMETLEEQGFKVKGKEVLAFSSHPSVLLWENCSKEFVKEIWELEKGKQIRLKPIKDNWDLMMLVDGLPEDLRLRKIPLAKSKRQYKEQRWMPHMVQHPEWVPSGGGLVFG